MDGSSVQPSLLWVRRNKREALWPAVAVPEGAIPRFAAAPTETRRLVLFLGDHTYARVPQSAVSADAGPGEEARDPAAQDAGWEARHLASGAAFDLSATSHDLWVRLGESRSLTFSRAPGGDAIEVKRANVRGANAGDTLLQLADSSFRGSDDVQEAILALRSAPSPVAVRLRRQLPSAEAGGGGAVAAEEVGDQIEFVDQRMLLGRPELECTGCSTRARPHTLRPEHRTKVHGTWLCGNCMVGRKVKVFWPVDGNWYIAEVLAYDAATGMHRLRYADGDEEPMSISCEQVVITAQELAAMGRRRKGSDAGGQAKAGHAAGAAGAGAGDTAPAAEPRARPRRGSTLPAQGPGLREGDSDLEFAVEEAEEGGGASGAAQRKRGRARRPRRTRRRGSRAGGRSDAGGASTEEEGSEGDSGDQRCPVPGFEDEEIHSILAKRQVLVHEGGGGAPLESQGAHAVDTQYLVRWEGRPLRDSVWVSLAYLGSDTTGKRKLGQYRKTLRGEVQSAEDRMESADGFPIEPELLSPDRVLALRTHPPDASAGGSASGQAEDGVEVPELVARGAFSDFVASEEGQALLAAPDAFRAVCRTVSSLPGREYFVKWCTLPYSQALWASAGAVGEKAAVRTYYTRMLAATGERPALLDSAAPCPLAEREMLQEGGDVAQLRRALDGGQRAMLTHVHDEDRFRVGSCIVHTQLRRDPGRLVILVCQLATLPAWRDEVGAWGTAEVVSYHGSAKDREVIHEREFDRPRGGGPPRARFDVMLLTPEMLAIELDFVRGLDHSLVVIDEAQRLKTATSRAARTMGALVDGGPALFLLASGARASPTEALTLLRLVDPESRATLADMDTGARTAPCGPLIRQRCAGRAVAPASKRGEDQRGPGDADGGLDPAPRSLTLVLFEVGDAELEAMRDVLACHAAGMKAGDENARLALTQRVLFRMREVLLSPGIALSAWSRQRSPMKGGKPERVAAAAAAASKRYRRVLVMSQSAASVREIVGLLAEQEGLGGRAGAVAQLTRVTAGDERVHTLAAFRAGDCAVLVQSSRVLGAVYELEAGDALICADCGWGYESRLPGLLRSTPPGVDVHLVVARNTLEGELVRRLLCSLRPHGELDHERVAPLYVQDPPVDANDLALQWALRFLTASGADAERAAALRAAGGGAEGDAADGVMRHVEVALDRPLPGQSLVREALFMEANPPDAAGMLSGMEESYSRLAATLLSGEASMRRAAVERLALAAGHGALHDETPSIAAKWQAMASRAGADQAGGLGFAGTLELAVARDPAPGDVFHVVQAPVQWVREAGEARRHKERSAASAAGAEEDDWEQQQDGDVGASGGGLGRMASSVSDGAAAGWDGDRPSRRRGGGGNKRRRVAPGRLSPRDGMPPPRQNVRRYVQHTEEAVMSWDQLQQLVCQAVCFGKVIQQRHVPSPHWLQGAVALTERRMVERAGTFHEDIRATLPLKPASPADAYEDVDVAVASRAVDVGLTLGANGYAYVNHVLIPSALPTHVGISMQGFRLGDVLLTVNGEALVGLSLRSIMGTVSQSATPRIFRVRRFQDINFYRSERAFAGKPGSRPMIQSLSTAPLRRALAPLRRGGRGGSGGAAGQAGLGASPSAGGSSTAFGTATAIHGPEAGPRAAQDWGPAGGPGAGSSGLEAGEWGAGGEFAAHGTELGAEEGMDGVDDMLGCNCTKSKCLQRHCSCFKMGRPCTEACRCIGCENCEGKRKYLRCARCGTTKTPVWRRGPQGQMLCNACGLLERRRGNVRRSRGKVQRRSTSDFVEMDEMEVTQLELMEAQAGAAEALGPTFAVAPGGGMPWDPVARIEAPAAAAADSADGVGTAQPAGAAPSGDDELAPHVEAGQAQE